MIDKYAYRGHDNRMNRALNRRLSALKHTVLGIVILSVASAASAGTDVKKKDATSRNLAFTFNFDYLTKWISRGRECYSEDGAFFETISADLWKTGFNAAVTHRSAGDGGWVNKQRLDYKWSYSNKLFADTALNTKYKLGYSYKNYYDKLENAAGKSKDSQMFLVKYSLPKLLGSSGLVPYGASTYDWPARGDDGYDKNWPGWVHTLGLGYDLKLSALPSPLYLTSEIAYTDGFRGADHDWSYATLGAATKIKLMENLTLVPRVYHQITMDDSVGQRKDITYGFISLVYKFGKIKSKVNVDKDELLIGRDLKSLGRERYARDSK